MGIFVALFTFISIEFQVFRSYRDPHAISGLTLIFLGAIFLFLVIFDYLLNKSSENNSKIKIRKGKFFYIMPLISVLLLAGGIFLYCNAPNEDLEEAKNSIKKQVYDSVKNDIDLKNDELLETNKNNEFLINDLRNDIEAIKNCVNNFGFSYKCFK